MDAHNLAYSVMTVTGLGAAFATSRALAMPKPPVKTQLDVYIAAMAGFLAGAKLPVWASYGFSPALIVDGKSVMGAMLGAFVGLQIYKRLTRQPDTAFGGRFTIPLAVGIGFGKIGCYFYGCCGGHFIVPVQLVESGFNFAAAAALYRFYRRTGRTDLLFPLYLTAYLVMRFAVEFVRTEPRIAFGLTLYQYLAMAFLPVFATILVQRRQAHA